MANSHSWADLFCRLPDPGVVVTTVRRHTTLNPRLEAGKELKALAFMLGRISTTEQATQWLGQYNH